MIHSMHARADIVEDAYAVVARVRDREDDGEESFRSDQLAAAFRIGEQLRARGRDPEVVEGEDGVFVRLFVGDDAPDRDYEAATGDMAEAVAW